jgi:hypothetical protein
MINFDAASARSLRPRLTQDRLDRASDVVPTWLDENHTRICRWEHY